MTTQLPLRLPPEPRWKPGQSPSREYVLRLERMLMLARMEINRLRAAMLAQDGRR